MSREAQIAKELGVTPAGLRWLAIAAARGKSSQRGNECTKLAASSYCHSVEKASHYRGGALDGQAYTYWRWEITDAGRDVVKRARAMGF